MLLEKSDEAIIDSLLQIIDVENIAKDSGMHIIHAGDYYTWKHDRLNSFVTKSLEKLNLKSAMITQIHMFRHVLITKEKMEKMCLGKADIDLKESVNDDLESVIENLQLGREPKPFSLTYFLPKLTEEELELVEKRDRDYFQTFYMCKNPDVKAEEMKLSESDSKYISGYCRRWTYMYRIDNPVFTDPNSSIESKSSIVSTSNVSNSNFDEKDADEKHKRHKFNCCCLQ